MSICCRDLFQLKYFSHAKLLAGEDGLNREISWPYTRTTESISEWLRGGELIFITDIGIKMDDKSLLVLLEECIDKKLSGIVIMMGDHYINSIPQMMIDRANEKNFPLFTIPWDIKLIDIMQEIVFKMQQKQEELNKSKHFFESLLFTQEQAYSDIRNLAELYSIKIRPFHYICIFRIQNLSDNSYDTNYILKNIFHSIEASLNKNHYTIVPMKHTNNLMVLLFANNYEDAKQSSETIAAIFNLMNLKYLNIEMCLSFSRIREKDSEIKTSYNEATTALSMIDICNKDTNIIKYKDLGIFRLLLKLNDIKDIEEYCYENLSSILEYDKKQGIDLIRTLKCYFKNNRHLSKTSQELFIHRNTLLYRLSVIKDLLKIDLDDAMTNLELFNSILIYEFIKLKNQA